MNEHGLYDIYGMWHVPFWQTQTFMRLMGLLFVTALCILVWFIAKRLRTTTKPLTAREQALRALQQLEQSSMTVQNAKEFYFQLTMILKKYLSAAYGYALTDKTDTESITYLTDHTFEPNKLEEVRTVFSGIQVIKFANAQAAQEQMVRDLNTCKSIIEWTQKQ